MLSLARRDAHTPAHTPARILAIGLIGASAAAVITSGVFAGLNATATNTTAQTVSDGTLSLTLADSGVGFSANITNLAPGDVVNRYVTLSNGGTLAAQGLTLGIAATPANPASAALITDGVAPVTTKALRVTVTSCSGSWAPLTGVCTGTASTEIAAAPLSTFTAAAQAFTRTSALEAKAAQSLQVSVCLPEQSETTTNGVLPTNTVQGGSVNLTYTFNELQRTATTTNS
jgi:hypothetical protein